MAQFVSEHNAPKAEADSSGMWLKAWPQSPGSNPGTIDSLTNSCGLWTRLSYERSCVPVPQAVLAEGEILWASIPRSLTQEIVHWP